MYTRRRTKNDHSRHNIFLEKKSLTKELQRPVVLVPDRGLRQFQLVSDLADGQPVKEMEAENFPALWRHEFNQVLDLHHPTVPFQLGLPRIVIFPVHQLLLIERRLAAPPHGSEVSDGFIPGDPKQKPIDVVELPDPRPGIIELDKGIADNVFRVLIPAHIIPDDQEQPREVPIIEDFEGSLVPSLKAVKKIVWFKRKQVVVLVHKQGIKGRYDSRIEHIRQ